MAKKKKVELPKKSVIRKTQEFGQRHEKTLWRSFLTALITVTTLLATNGPGWVEKYFDAQKAQGERQVAWQKRAETRHQALLANDSMLINQNNLILKHFKIKIK